MEYVIAKQHQLIGQQIPIPECEDLPPITSKDHQSCIRLGVRVDPLVEEGKKLVKYYKSKVKLKLIILLKL